MLTELIFFFFIGVRSSQFNLRPYQDDTHTDLSLAFFLHLLTFFDFGAFSVQFKHLNFGILAFLSE